MTRSSEVSVATEWSTDGSVVIAASVVAVGTSFVTGVAVEVVGLRPPMDGANLDLPGFSINKFKSDYFRYFKTLFTDTEG